jgi:putative ABC transport system ATP-binding protein
MTSVRFAWPGRSAFGLAIESFALAAGERVLLIGPSGTGKSTFLSLLCGVVTPQAGSIRVLGSELTGFSSSARDRFRAEHFGIIFQMFNLLPYATARDNVLLPLHFANQRRARAARTHSVEEEAIRLLARVGIAPGLMAGPRAATFSVGQQQRVAAARALIGAPEIIVADEPTSSLDRNRQTQFLDLLFAEAARHGSAIIMVSHDESLAPRFDRVIRLDHIATTYTAVPA